MQKFFDTAIGYYRRKRKTLMFGRSLDEVLDYYYYRYQEFGPDPERFKRLVRRSGLPLHKNPIPEGEIEHFLLPPEVMFFSDIEYPLTYVNACFKEDRLFSPHDILWIEDAAACWAVALLNGDKEDFKLLYKEVHLDNLTLLTIFTLQYDVLSKWGISREDVASMAESLSLINADVRKEILSHPVKSLKDEVKEKGLELNQKIDTEVVLDLGVENER